jgi:glycosyltransferase involved in cell wall biosynthesis
VTPPGGAPTVALNGRSLARDQLGGVERYATEIVRRLVAIDPDRYQPYVPRPRLAHRLGHAWEQLVLPVIARDARLIYSPANLAPLAARRNVVVLHDVAALAHPEAYSGGYVAYQRALLPRIVRAALRLITVSEFSRGEIVARLGADPDRIAVVPGGVDAERFAAGRAPEAIAAARRGLGLERPYVLAIGTESARKNHRALAPAAACLASRGIEIVLAGSSRSYLRGGDRASASDHPQLRRLGYVPEALLAGLYAGARAVVLPSIYEGFGLPCLEAMAAGAPVVASAAGALPETCGDAALLVDPSSPAELSEALLAAACEEGLRSGLIARGTRRAHKLSWARAAEATHAELSALACERAPGRALRSDP